MFVANKRLLAYGHKFCWFFIFFTDAVCRSSGITYVVKLYKSCSRRKSVTLVDYFLINYVFIRLCYIANNDISQSLFVCPSAFNTELSLTDSVKSYMNL